MSKILNEKQKKVKFALFVYFDLLKIQTIVSFVMSCAVMTCVTKVINKYEINVC